MGKLSDRTDRRNRRQLEIEYMILLFVFFWKHKE